MPTLQAVPTPVTRRRVILPRFLFGGDGNAGNDDGDDGGGGIILPIVEFEQQAGPFVIPPTSLPPAAGVPNGPFGADVPLNDGSGGTTRMYFNAFAALGDYNVKYRRIPLNPNQVSCNQLTPPVPDGDAHSGAGGNVTRNPVTGLWAGVVNLTAYQEGIAPGPGGNAPAIPGVRTASAWTETGVQNGIQELGGPIVAENTIQGQTPGAYYKILTGGHEINPAGGGYFVAGWLNSIPCTSVMRFDYTDRYTLITVPTVFGAPARTQSLGTFTPDGSGGGTYAGNASRIRVSFVAPADTATYFFTYLVTPAVGDPYRLTWSERLTVVPGAFTSIVREFPPIADATVFIESWEVLFNREAAEDWASYLPAVFETLGGSGSWGQNPSFGGGGPWDDFEDWEFTANTTVSRLETGYWDGVATFSSVNFEEASDDFEGYPAGTILQLNRGTGWPVTGLAGQDDPFQAFDDFEADAVGSITELPWTVDNFNRWGGPGTFADPAVMAWDDFESYASGVILTLPTPADPDNHFGTGTFG